MYIRNGMNWPRKGSLLADLIINNLLSGLDDTDRLCGLVVRVSGYRYRGLEFDSRRYQIF